MCEAAGDGMSVIVGSHEMSFASEGGDRGSFMDGGKFGEGVGGRCRT